jgi:hypothetical protein
VVDADVIEWVRDQCTGFDFDVAGVFRRRGEHGWPLTAGDAEELALKLHHGRHLLPLPKEPAALANVLEVAIVDHLLNAAAEDPGIEAVRGSERSYPDLELSGPRFGGRFHALDVKVARRARNPVRTQSRITLYTGNTYFKWPSLHWPGTIRPFADYEQHLDLVVIYNFVPDSSAKSGGSRADRAASVAHREPTAVVDDQGVHRRGRRHRPAPGGSWRL